MIQSLFLMVFFLCFSQCNKKKPHLHTSTLTHTSKVPKEDTKNLLLLGMGDSVTGDETKIVGEGGYFTFLTKALPGFEKRNISQDCSILREHVKQVEALPPPRKIWYCCMEYLR